MSSAIGKLISYDLRNDNDDDADKHRRAFIKIGKVRDVEGSISPIFYMQLLSAQIPKAPKGNPS